MHRLFLSSAKQVKQQVPKQPAKPVRFNTAELVAAVKASQPKAGLAHREPDVLEAEKSQEVLTHKKEGDNDGACTGTGADRTHSLNASLPDAALDACAHAEATGPHLAELSIAVTQLLSEVATARERVAALLRSRDALPAAARGAGEPACRAYGADDMLTIEQAAKVAGIGRATAYKFQKTKGFPIGAKYGRNRRIRYSDLVAWTKENHA